VPDLRARRYPAAQCSDSALSRVHSFHLRPTEPTPVDACQSHPPRSHNQPILVNDAWITPGRDLPFSDIRRLFADTHRPPRLFDGHETRLRQLNETWGTISCRHPDAGGHGRAFQLPSGRPDREEP